LIHDNFTHIQLVENLVKAERRVVHALEELASLSRQWTVAREYCTRRIDILARAVVRRESELNELKELLPSTIKQRMDILGRIKLVSGELFILNGSANYVGCIRRWKTLVEELDALSEGKFVGRGRMYLTYADSEDDKDDE
jgi:hypothetical protein